MLAARRMMIDRAQHVVAGIADTFDRANSTTTVNPPSDGGGNWTDERNAFGINSNEAYVHGDSGTGKLWGFSGLVIHRDLASTVQTVQVDVDSAAVGNNFHIYWSLATGSPGIAYALVVNRGSGTYNLYKYKSDGTAVGPLTSGGLGVSFSGVKRTVKVTYNTGVIKVFVGGTLIFTFTDTSPLSGTRVGLGQFISDTGTNFKWDNFAAFRGIV